MGQESVAIIGEGNLGQRTGESMTHNNRQLRTPLFLVFLMILAPFAAAANVTTFGNGNDTTDVELRDGTAFVDTDAGTIHLPASETVTSASLDLSTTWLNTVRIHVLILKQCPVYGIQCITINSPSFRTTLISHMKKAPTPSQFN